MRSSNSTPIALSRRIVTLRPSSRDELRAMVVDRARGVIWPRTRASFGQDEPVLIELRMPWADGEQRCMLRALARYSIPEGRGPMFLCDSRDLRALRFVALETEGTTLQRRAHTRYPVAIHAAVRLDGGQPRRATLADLSAAGARLDLDEPLPEGTRVYLELPAFPRRLLARVCGERDGLQVVRFYGPGSLGWRELRRALRRSVETGRWRLPG
jgi:hypothetical protein